MQIEPTRNLALELVRVTEAAALSAGRYMGRGDKNAADHAAVEAMRLVLNSIQMNAVIVIGEGEKDEAPMLGNGEHVGNGMGIEMDIALGCHQKRDHTYPTSCMAALFWLMALSTAAFSKDFGNPALFFRNSISPLSLAIRMA